MKSYSIFGKIISIIAIGRDDDCYITAEYRADLIGSDGVNIQYYICSMRNPPRYPSCFDEVRCIHVANITAVYADNNNY